MRLLGLVPISRPWPEEADRGRIADDTHSVEARLARLVHGRQPELPAESAADIRSIQEQIAQIDKGVVLLDVQAKIANRLNDF